MLLLRKHTVRHISYYRIKFIIIINNLLIKIKYSVLSIIHGIGWLSTDKRILRIIRKIKFYNKK